MIVRGSILSVALLVCASVLSSCVIPGDEGGADGVISKVNAALNAGDCTAAITEIEPLYNSAGTSDQVRRLRASAHGCRAGLGFYEKIETLANADLSSFGPWREITLMFPSSSTDGKAESSFYASDALQSWIKKGVVVFNPYRLSFDPYNPGSMRAQDLVLDANIYLVLTSLATIGTLHNRYGRPDILGAPTASLPWSTLSAVDQEGCGYVSAVLTLSDALTEVGSSITQLGNLNTQIQSLTSAYDAACSAGCTACGLSCSTCPKSLRHRTACDRTLPGTVDIEACAAAGLVANFMNSNLVGWR